MSTELFRIERPGLPPIIGRPDRMLYHWRAIGGVMIACATVVYLIMWTLSP